MRELKDIIYKVSLTSSYGDMNTLVSGICFDSRKVKANYLFVALKGTLSDGHEYIPKAIESGASVVVCEKLQNTINEKVTYVTVKDSAQALGIIASNFFGNPSEKLKLTGVTGTNGKTTTVTLLYKLFSALGYNVGMISTVENRIIDDPVPSTHTTPDPIQLNGLLKTMIDKGCSHAFMEVSSHAVDQERIAGVRFAGAVFTNITHDHLDYHKTFENYIKSKKKYFDELPSDAFALVNVDDKRGMVMLQNTRATKYT